MTKLLYDQGDAINYKLTKAASYGDIVQLGTIGGIALDAGKSTDIIAVRIAGGIYQEAADTTAAFSIGDALYWDSGAGKLTKESAGMARMGICTKDKAASGAVAEFRLG